MKPIRDARLRLLGPIGLFLFVALFFRLDLYFRLPLRVILLNDVVALSAGIVFWQVARWVVLRIQKAHPGLPNTRKRMLWLLAVLPVMVNVAWMVRYFIRYLLDGETFIINDPVVLSRTIGIQIFYHFIYFVIYEGGYVLREWRRETIERNSQQKLTIQSQLSSLQNQVNPHFLFNSLNSLSSLISENPARADQFLDELTAVFRYLLQAGEQKLVPLRDELLFIDSYYHLLKTRYPTGLALLTTVDERFLDTLLPPLTLQTLVENAVRYNTILPERPLLIRIRTSPDQRLWVENTLQRKTIRVDTAGLGLTNLGAKYELLGQGLPDIEERDGWFVVSMPLISEEVNA